MPHSRSASNTHLPHFSPLSTTTTNLTTSTVASSSAPTATLPPADQPSLLIPTDRSIAELESQAGSSSSSGVSWLGQLGRLRVEREVVLSGYALYALRTWYLSRDHWSQSIVTQTGKQTEQISVYRLVADASLSTTEAEAEIARATQRLAVDTKSTPRKTEWGTLLVTTPGAFGQDAFFVPGGDLREARPYLVVNTGLRRLGCGGRAAMTLEVPIPALRRKFLEVYRLPAPPSALTLSRTNSPQSSPSKPSTNRNQQSPHSPRGPSTPSVLTDPLCLMVLEVVRLIQASLALWGLFEPEAVDGLFCDETKKGIGLWRRNMGMEHEESLKIEKETSGGCIDPRTLAVLLSSVTSTYYQLATLGQDKLLKDPFTRVHRFLDQWHAYHASAGHSHFSSSYLSVDSIRSLTAEFHAQRSRTGTDPLKMHRAFFSGVASATSSIHANLKGGYIDDTPLRKREHHSPSRSGTIDGNGSGDSKGLSLIIPDDDATSVASPNAITSNLEAYIHGVLKTREKDREAIGARRIGALWSGHLAGTDWADSGKRRFRDVVRRRKRSMSRDPYPLDDGAESSPPSASAARGGHLNGVVRRTGSVLIGGLGGLVSRKGTAYETSDSEGGVGPSSVKNSMRNKPSVPVLIEPDVDEAEEHVNARASLSPSPTNLDRPHSITSHFHGLSVGSRGSKRPSIVTSSSAGSHLSLALQHPVSWSPDADHRQRSSAHPAGETHQLSEIWERDGRHGINGYGQGQASSSGTHTERTVAWRDANRQAPTAMMRTASDGAEVIIPDAGIEWEVVNPHGTGHRYGSRLRYPGFAKLKRRHSLEDRRYYDGMVRIAAKNLSIDVELSHTVRQLKKREQDLIRKAAELKAVERSIQSATQSMRNHLSSRRQTLKQLKDDARHLEAHLQRLPDEVDTDETINDLTQKIAYHTTGDTNSQELKWRLVDLLEEWEIARKGNEARRKQAEVVDVQRSGGWW